jgi:hypothetical protein
VRQFSIISYLAKAILGTHGSHIEIERFFSIVGILTCLCHCRHGAKNLDVIVLQIKNWFNDPIVGFEV